MPPGFGLNGSYEEDGEVYFSDLSDPLTDSSGEEDDHTDGDTEIEEGNGSEESNSADDTVSSDGVRSMRDPGEVHYTDVADRVPELTEDEVYLMTFGTTEEAEIFYTIYSKSMGFAIRKEDVKRMKNSDVIQARLWVCNREGHRRSIKSKRRSYTQKKYEPRPVWKVGCEAHMRVKIDIDTGKYIVASFSNDHNHELFPQEMVHHDRGHRKINAEDAAVINSMRDVGISTRQIVDYMAKSAGGHGNVGFNEKDVYNYIYRAQVKERTGGDAAVVLAYLNGKKKGEPDFFFKYTVDTDNRLSRLFWADSISRCDYELFGDVLVFDSTYKNNVYHKPLVVLAGTNNHFLTCVFGCAVIADEKDDTYEWVLETFVECMRYKLPDAVLTDGDLAMGKAISIVMPNAIHRLCSWHLKKNANQNIHKEGFLQAFADLMRRVCTVDEFEVEWRHILVEFELEGNAWMMELYNKRFKWAEAYLRGHFFAGMRSTQRCEKMNSYLNKYLKSRHRLYQLVIQYELAVANLRDKEVSAYRISAYSQPVFTTRLRRLERQASNLFTRRIFFKIRDEMLAVAGVVTEDIELFDGGVMYTVSVTGQPEHVWEVEINQDWTSITCSCGKLDSSGLPCAHILHVLVSQHVKRFPECLVLKRWTKNAKSKELFALNKSSIPESVVRTYRIGALNAVSREACRTGATSPHSYREALRMFTNVGGIPNEEDTMHCNDAADDSESEDIRIDPEFASIRDPLVAQGRGRGRMQGGRGRGRKACSLCRNYGHNKATCIQRRRIYRNLVPPVPRQDARVTDSDSAVFHQSYEAGSSGYTDFTTSSAWQSSARAVSGDYDVYASQMSQSNGNINL